jgi:peptidoglycan L-alanyl-D-glutamate endopeptidase CwlK
VAKLGAGSLAIRGELHPDLQRVVDETVRLLSAAGTLDLKLLVGWRSAAEQEAAFKAGKSQKKPGTSKHNSMPARAVDMALYPVVWKDEVMFGYLAGIVAVASANVGVKTRWGGDWDSDGNTLEHTLRDLDHWELI